MRVLSQAEGSYLRQRVTPWAKSVGALALLAACHVAVAEEASLEKCDAPKGTLAIAEPQGHIIMALRAYNLPPPTQLLRQYVQNSNCFQVLERGLAMQNIQQERDLADNGMLQRNSNMGGSQMVTADFVMTADVLFKDKNAGGAGVGAAVGSLFGGIGSLVGAVAGGIKIQEAATTLTLSDVRSTLQVAAASGTYKKSDWAFGGVLGAVGGGAYTSTEEGKLVAGALLDNYNNIVRDVRDDPSLLASTSEVGQQNAEESLQASDFAPGAVLSAKLANVKVTAAADKGSEVVTTLTKGEEVVFLGESEDGFLLIQGAEAEGWVREILMTE
ncbi:SH3 domain-containing protein [Luminiphilus sp.]|nr:CsgG/HfaB family protein [Luminiphilus sp.]MDA9711241.1 SH3 domain-containing protein [Luminiphilus sp.]